MDEYIVEKRGAWFQKLMGVNFPVIKPTAFFNPKYGRSLRVEVATTPHTMLGNKQPLTALSEVHVVKETTPLPPAAWERDFKAETSNLLV